MDRVSPQLIEECRRKLIQLRANLLNRVRSNRFHFIQRETGGDEADQTMRILAENEILAEQRMVQHQILEIEAALGRIESGTYGTCEETDEPIEAERLRALPWTRLSIEGAEIHEAIERRFVR